jgi:DHA1 family florfenicol/chloramphenicol resistance protein-like MFS transporter
MLLSAVIFFVGSVLCALSTSIEFLILSRVVQAFGCCGLSVVAFAIVRDVFSGKTSSMVYSFINAIISVSPILGPLIGVKLAMHFEWNAAFILLSILSLIIALMVLLFVKESLPVERRKKMTTSVFSRYAIVLKSLPFWAYSMTAVTGMSAFFTLFSMTPYIISHLGFPISKIYVMFGSSGVSYLVGCIFSGFLVNSLGVYKTAIFGVGCVLLAGVVSLSVYFTYGLTLWGFFAPCFLATFGAAFTSGTGASGSMEPFYEIAGVAAAMFGTIEFALAGMIGSLAMLFPATTSLPIAITMIVVSMVAIVLLVLANKNNIYVNIIEL